MEAVAIQRYAGPAFCNAPPASALPIPKKLVFQDEPCSDQCPSSPCLSDVSMDSRSTDSSSPISSTSSITGMSSSSSLSIDDQTISEQEEHYDIFPSKCTESQDGPADQSETDYRNVSSTNHRSGSYWIPQALGRQLESYEKRTSEQYPIWTLQRLRNTNLASGPAPEHTSTQFTLDTADPDLFHIQMIQQAIIDKIERQAMYYVQKPIRKSTADSRTTSKRIQYAQLKPELLAPSSTKKTIDNHYDQRQHVVSDPAMRQAEQARLAQKGRFRHAQMEWLVDARGRWLMLEEQIHIRQRRICQLEAIKHEIMAEWNDKDV